MLKISNEEWINTKPTTRKNLLTSITNEFGSNSEKHQTTSEDESGITSETNSEDEERNRILLGTITKQPSSPSCV